MSSETRRALKYIDFAVSVLVIWRHRPADGVVSWPLRKGTLARQVQQGLFVGLVWRVKGLVGLVWRVKGLVGLVWRVKGLVGVVWRVKGLVGLVWRVG